jgi:phage terminase small subunit
MPKGGKRYRSGPPRKPTELRVIEGTFKQSRHGHAPVTPAGGFPDAPAHLNEAERALWETFPRVNWIAPSDVVAVNAAVSIYERILRNQKAQQATPEAGNPLSFKVTVDGDGNPAMEPKPNPLITQELQLWGRLMSVLATLGLTPADRAKMQAPKADAAAEDKWAGLL